jgi:hypothetical protein
MALLTGRKGTTTPRDQHIIKALFSCRYLATKQLAEMFFGSEGRARARLIDLEEKGYITNRVFYVAQPTEKTMATKQSVWHLTKDGHDAVAATLGLEEPYVPKQLLPENAEHYVLAGEVYVAAREALEAELGPYPGWEWRHEKRVLYVGEYENEPYVHNPDAHILFREHVFILERQTRASKVGPKTIYRKVRDHKLYAGMRLKKPAEVLFALDGDDEPEDVRMAAQARRAGDQYGIRVVAGGVDAIADYLYSQALRLS